MQRMLQTTLYQKVNQGLSPNLNAKKSNYYFRQWENMMYYDICIGNYFSRQPWQMF